jgi:urease accessory protein
MPTDPAAPTELLARVRLLQLVSPALPIGGFTYSQGLEWAVEAGWVVDVETLEDWLTGLIEDGLATLDLPILARLMGACTRGDWESVTRWSERLLAARETDELRREERHRARALVALLGDLGIEDAGRRRDALLHCQAAPFALAVVRWRIMPRDGLLGYAWGWLENQVAAAVKLIPLGQTDGQRIALRLAAGLPAVVERALDIDEDEIGSSAPALAIASALHETQYTRLFRS